MTGSVIITKFQNMVDDVLDEDFAYQLLNDAKDEIEAMHVWEQLKKEQTYTVTAGTDYSTAIGTLPTRFALDVRMTDALGTPEYSKVSFDDLQGKRNNALSYFIDLNAGNLHISGENNAAASLVFCYTEYSADIASGTEWGFPSRFHHLLPLKMAELYYLADAGERGRSWDDKWAQQFERGIRLMETWNDRLKLTNKSRGGATATARNTVGRW